MDAPTDPARSSPPARTSIAWAGSALFLTAIVGVAAKVFGVLVAPGMRGVASQKAMETTELLSSTLGYTFAALLVALVCGGSFELARVRKIGVGTRGVVVAVSGLVVALASPAVVQRLHSVAALLLAMITGLIVLIAGVTAARAAQTRAVGAVLALLSLAGIARPLAWLFSSMAGERASLGLYHFARGVATAGVALQAIATLLAAAWLGTRSRWRGRMLANLAVFGGFVITYIAARETDAPPSALEAVLRGSLAQTAGVPAPYALSSIAAFLVPASILLAAVALVQRAQAAAVLVATALALLSQGAFDVPLQALAATAAAQWALLAMVDERTMWTSLVGSRDGQDGERRGEKRGEGDQPRDGDEPRGRDDVAARGIEPT